MILIAINQEEFWNLRKSRTGEITVNVDREIKEDDEMILMTESMCKIFCVITSVINIDESRVKVKYKIYGEQITN